MIFLRINLERRSYVIIKLWSYILKNLKQIVVISKKLLIGKEKPEKKSSTHEPHKHKK